jgi:hypothetical protein
MPCRRYRGRSGRDARRRARPIWTSESLGSLFGFPFFSSFFFLLPSSPLLSSPPGSQWPPRPAQSGAFGHPSPCTTLAMVERQPGALISGSPSSIRRYSASLLSLYPSLTLCPRQKDPVVLFRVSRDRPGQLGPSRRQLRVRPLAVEANFIPTLTSALN